MDDQQSTFKVVDRRPFNPDGTPRELSPEAKQETERGVIPFMLTNGGMVNIVRQTNHELVAVWDRRDFD